MSKSTTAQGIILTQKAEIKQVRLPVDDFSLSAAKAILKKKDEPEVIGSYKYKSVTLTLLGYVKGKAGTENKHELPPPLDNNLYFGDILVVASQNGNYAKPVTFKPEEYEAFYTKMFGGFDDLDSDEEDEEEEEEEAEPEVEVEAEAEAEAEPEAEEEEDEEEEDEDEEAEPEVDMAEFEAGEAVPVVRAPKTSKKKRPPPSLLISQTGTSQILHCPKEEHLTDTSDSQHNLRKLARKQIQTAFENSGISDVSVDELEHNLYLASIKDAEARHVTCHWQNKLFQHLYETRVRHMCGNLIPVSYVGNTKLLDSLRTGTVTIPQMCSLDTYAIDNARWKDYIHRRTQREKRQLEGNKAMATAQFLCMRCHKRECTYYEMQTRSADEPMTIFITCINCGKHWRQ